MEISADLTSVDRLMQPSRNLASCIDIRPGCISILSRSTTESKDCRLQRVDYERRERETTCKDFLVFLFSSQKCKYFACDHHLIFNSCLDTRQPETVFKKLDTRQSEILTNFLEIARLIPLRT